MHPKKILYIKAQGLGDMISGIPFLVEMKAQGHEVRHVFYDMDALRYLYAPRKIFSPTYRKAIRELKKTPMFQGRFRILDLFRKQWLIQNILFIPFGLFDLCRLLSKYRNFFDEAVITIGTKPAKILGNLLAKKTTVIFDHPNDITRYKITSEGELGHLPNALSTYHTHLPLPTKRVDLPQKYVAIFPSVFERSPEMSIWKDIIASLREKNIVPVVIWGSREDRFISELKSQHLYELVIDMIGKTNFEEMVWIVQHSQVNIMGNGGVMRVANLVNQKNINIHTVSSFLMEPPVDHKYSFNIRPYPYPQCRPCEAASLPYSGRIPKCVFYNTSREGECRQFITAKMIIILLEKLL